MPTRRQLLLAGAAVLGMAAFARAADCGPNVVLIISDDQAWTDYGFMGHRHIRTPNIDRLASQGLVFKRGYVPSSLCSPSLASILTGLYPHQHKVTSNDPPLPPGKSGQAALGDPTYLAQRQEVIGYFDHLSSLPRLLAGQGYTSFQAGKWWGGNYRRGGFTEGMTHGDPERGGRHGDLGLTIGRETMRPVLDFIDRSAAAGKPFFLWYAPMMPHSPHNPPARLLAKYRGAAPSLEEAKYWAMCEWFDETCGELLGRLDARGIADDTLVVFLADNGWIQDPTADRYAPRSKQSQYDGGLRTPIIVKWPGKVRPASSDRPVLSIDLAPTILTAAGLKSAPGMQGINLLDESAVARRTTIFGEIFTHNSVDIRRPAASLRYRWALSDHLKLILPARQNTPDGTPELFDIVADPYETHNLAARNPAEVERLTKLTDAWWSAD
jgi:arylsulfatase A-like enzyme